MTDPPEKKLPNFDLSAFKLPDLTGNIAGGENSAQTVGEKFVVFALDNEFFAVSAKQVAEVVQPLFLTPLPNVPEWLLGMANLRGSIISVVNLLKLWGRKTSSASPKTKFIVLRSFKDASPVAFTVDKLSEIATLPNEKIQFIENDQSFFAKATHKSNILHLIDTEKLFSSLKINCQNRLR